MTQEVNKTISKGEFHSTSAFSNTFPLVVLFGMILFINVKKLQKKEENRERKFKKIPLYSFLPFGFKVPRIFEAIAGAAKARSGIKFVEKILQDCPNYEVIRVKGLTTDIFFAKSPQLVQKLLGSNDQRVLHKPQYLYELIFLDGLQDGLLSSKFEIWCPHRKILNNCFTYNALQSYVRVMNKHGNRLNSDFMQCFSKNEEINGDFLSDAIYFHTLNIISEVTMGEEIFSSEENESFHFHLTQYKALVVYRMLNSHNLIPIIWRFNPKKKVLEHHTKELFALVEKAIQRWIAKINAGKRKVEAGQKESKFCSIIEEMIANNASEQEIRSEVCMFLLAGHESTVLAVKYFLQHVAENPEAQRACQQEVDELYESKSLLQDILPTTSNELKMTDLAELKCLERCILETLRLTTVAPLIFRHLSAPMEVEGFQFRKNTIFCIPIWALHRDSKSWENPSQFNPDRFLPENIGERHPYSFIGFSQGPRNCIGYKFAMMELKIILAAILHNFDISTQDKLNDIKIHFDITASPERDYRISLTRREKK